AARVAQREWWRLSSLERADALHRVADRLNEMAPLIGECLTREMGKPYRESNWEGGASASSFRYYAEIARHEQGRLAGSATAGQMHFTLKEPLGVVVSIVPFNFPVLLFANASEREAVNIGRLCVALVAAAALVIAADPESEVLGLVANAWAGFGAAFGPLILLALTWDRMTGAGAVAGLVTGAAVVAGWIALGWNKAFMGGPGLYEIVPGFLASFAAILVVSRLTARAPAKM
ncbi:MAG: aldehyde dehydrogenase family protein, partial [Erythrobacter sp.]